MCSVVVFEASFRVSAPSFGPPHDSELFRRFAGFADRGATPVRTQGIVGIVGPDAVECIVHTTAVRVRLEYTVKKGSGLCLAATVSAS